MPPGRRKAFGRIALAFLFEAVGKTIAIQVEMVEDEVP